MKTLFAQICSYYGKRLLGFFLGFNDFFDIMDFFLEIVVPFGFSFVFLCLSLYSTPLSDWVFPFLSAVGFWLFFRGIGKQKKMDKWPSLKNVVLGLIFWIVVGNLFYEIWSGIPKINWKFSDNPLDRWFWFAAVLLPKKKEEIK